MLIDEVKCIEMPVYRSQLEVRPDLLISFQRPPPNLWWRFWQWALLGFRWKSID